MEKTYTLTVAGVTRELPLCPVNEHLDIAAFIMFGDVEMTIACAKALYERSLDGGGSFHHNTRGSKVGH